MSDPFIGQITMFAGPYVPEGWAACDGSLLQIQANQVLFALLGTTYGGDGVQTFALPDLRGRAVISTGTMPGGTIAWALGTKDGQETVTLTESQIPAHTHAFTAASNSATQTSPVTAYFGADLPSENSYSATGALTPLVDGCISMEFGLPTQQPHNNMAPFIAINYIIATGGTYPSPQ